MITLISQPHDFVLMKLFYAPGSSSLLPHIALHEAGLPFEAVKIDEHTKAITGGGDYRSVNPLGYVPALVLDDGTLLTEGAAIVQYIADLVPSKELAPPNGTIERVRLQAWLNFFASEMHKGGFSPLFYKGVPENGRDVFRARLKARFEHLDGHLSANEYLMGSHYSVADAHFFVVSNWASWVNFDLSSYHAVIAHRERVGARPAVVAALTTEGLVP
jgi:glutathione S-transferase